jgi:hypothetical protein
MHPIATVGVDAGAAARQGTFAVLAGIAAVSFAAHYLLRPA